MIPQLFSEPKNRKVAIAIALITTILPFPIAGIHKFYLGQPLWGAIYLLLWYTPLPRIATAIDAVWYFVQGDEVFEQQFNQASAFNNGSMSSSPGMPTPPVAAIAEGLRELERLRREGLVTEYEFEEKRRGLLDRLT